MEKFIFTIYIPIILGIVVTAGAIYVIASVIRDIKDY
jgi:hypothetical protein